MSTDAPLCKEACLHKTGSNEASHAESRKETVFLFVCFGFFCLVGVFLFIYLGFFVCFFFFFPASKRNYSEI